MVHILVIDDETAIRLLLRSIFEGHDYQVVEASNGMEGLQACLHTHPDLVVTDLEMPRMGIPGAAFIHALQQACPTALVIAMSGNPDVLNSVSAFTVHTLAKPFQLQQVLATVQALVGLPAAGASLIPTQEATTGVPPVR
jgi:two-component system KDP operon response regulator KdpE